MTDHTKDDSIDQDRMAQWQMAAKLPYTLTEGVTATREGLRIDAAINPIAHYIMDGLVNQDPVCTTPWPDAAERLQYRENEPYCYVADSYDESLVCEPAMYDAVEKPLNRLAAILCDDAEAFRVLHWCVTSMLQEAGDE